jgi:hypothetical protein
MMIWWATLEPWEQKLIVGEVVFIVFCAWVFG